MTKHRSRARPARWRNRGDIAWAELGSWSARWRAVGRGAAAGRLVLSSALAAGLPAVAAAQDAAQAYDIDVPAGPLDQALRSFARQAGLGALELPDLAGRASAGLKGRYGIDQGFAILLAGSGLAAARGPSGYAIVAAATAGQAGKGGKGAVLPTIALEAATTRLYDPAPEPGGFKADYQTAATKTEQALRETPQSVSVITRDSLEARQVRHLSQALETAAGVTLYSGAGPFSGVDPFEFGGIQIRGIDTDYLTDTREDGYMSPVTGAMPDLAPYERIEVVKGPNSVLYGRGSAGGFVNRVTKKPLDTPLATGEVSIGSFNQIRAEGDVTGPLLESERVRGRLVFAYQDDESYVDFAESRHGLIAPSLSVDLTDTTRLLIQGNYQREDATPNPGFPLALKNGHYVAPDIRRSLYVGVPDGNDIDVTRASASAQLDQQIGTDWLATLRLQRGTSKSNIHLDNYAYGIAADGSGDVGIYGGDFDFNTDTWSSELRFNGKVDVFGRPLNIGFGAERSRVTSLNNQRYAYIGTANIYDEDFNAVATPPNFPHSYDALTRLKTTGAYVQFQVRPVDRVNLLLGGRYDHTNTALTDRMTKDRTADNQSRFTGRVGLVIDVTDNISVYGLYGRSFNPVMDFTRDGSILPPETGVIYETGLKTEWLDGRLGVNAAIFRINRDNVVIPDPGNGSFSISGGLQRSDGFELEVNGTPVPGWQLGFAGTLLDSKFVRREDPAYGTTPLGSADWQVGLYTSYEIQHGALRGFGAGFGLYAIDDRGLADATLKGYARLDAGLFYNGFSRVKVRLQVRNLLDARYVEAADRPAYATFGAPRAAMLSLSYGFGLGR